ncbi:MAG: ATP-dependent RecD-like DNA helicase [Butyribacter sp.]|nr:ATP-dependent RecD-like DNA helicase [bacterium]MDY3853618.1 ATP-dependent RecD-like DNA helicase [Butyribacter sp.]
MEEFEGYVERITFRNEENGYTVLYLVKPQADEEEEQEECCVGCFSYVAEGQYLLVRGKRVIHKNYGPQLQVESYEEKQPTDKMAVERYLGSGAIKGVGPALAARIVRRFGEETFDIMEREPERLAEVKGISQKMAVNIARQFNEKQQMRQAMIFLQDYGISMNMAVKIYRYYQDDMYEVLRKNPYRLAEDITGIGFKIADSIAKKAGFYTDSEYRIRAGVMYTLQQSGNQGHCYLPEKELIAQTADLLRLSEEQIANQIDALTMNKEILIEEIAGERRLYSSTLYYMEMNCARMLLDLNLDFPVDEKLLEKRITKIERAEGITLDIMQKNAVYQAVQNGVTIITGGPGTGKTTTIHTILQVLEQDGMDVLLAAPTGRAAKRMSETTGWEAQTIHRLLELNGSVDSDDKSGMHFERNELQPLEADVVIVDEFSMVDIYLLNALLKALVPGCRLIIVGDVNQLPSVGPGNVLRDMIKSEFCNVVCLNQIFRQAAESQIVVNAHMINAGRDISLDNKNNDFFHLERKNVQDIINVTIQLVMKNMPKYVDATPYDIQVLTPMRKGELGVENLNRVLQGFVNPKDIRKTEREFHGTLFREQDKIMQIKNDYQIKWVKRTRFGDVYEEGTGVFNGDIGIIRRIIETEEVVEVEFEEGKIVTYEYSQMDEMELAYAITIHKSQGSEYPAVVIPILTGPRMLLNRNLLYTAVTRAKKCVTLVGSSETIHQMIRNVFEQKRYSSLCQRLQEMKEETY